MIYICIIFFLRTFSNVNILHKGLLLQDWVFRLGLLPMLVFLDNRLKQTDNTPLQFWPQKPKFKFKWPKATLQFCNAFYGLKHFLNACLFIWCSGVKNGNSFVIFASYEIKFCRLDIQCKCGKTCMNCWALMNETSPILAHIIQEKKVGHKNTVADLVDNRLKILNLIET